MWKRSNSNTCNFRFLVLFTFVKISASDNVDGMLPGTDYYEFHWAQWKERSPFWRCKLHVAIFFPFYLLYHDSYFLFLFLLKSFIKLIDNCMVVSTWNESFDMNIFLNIRSHATFWTKERYASWAQRVLEQLWEHFSHHVRIFSWYRAYYFFISTLFDFQRSFFTKLSALLSARMTYITTIELW